MAQHRRGPGDSNRAGRGRERAARRRSGAGFSASRAPSLDLPRALSGLLRSTLEQFGGLGEAALERARSSRGRLDHVMLERKRRDALARLGEAVYLRAVRGQLGLLGEQPEIAELLMAVEDVDERLAEAGDFDADPGDYEAVASADWRPPAAPRDPEVGTRVWRPVPPRDERPADPAGADAGPDAEALGDLAELAEQVFQTPRKRDPDPVPTPRADRPRRGRGRRSRSARTQPDSDRGGIAFVSDAIGADDDLAAYMHDDDVPSTSGPSTSGPSTSGPSTSGPSTSSPSTSGPDDDSV